MIKVLRIIARLNIGGPAIHAILLTEKLNKQKFESVLVAGVVGSNEGDMTYLANDRGINPIVIKELGREISWRDDLIALWKLFRLLRKENPDIVHTHTAKAGTLGRISVIIYNGLLFIKTIMNNIKPFFLKKREHEAANKIKLIHTFHGHVFHSYFGKIKTKLFIFIERSLARFTDRIITISSLQAAEIKDNLHIVSPERITTISLGLDLNKYIKNTVNGDSFREKFGVLKSTVFVGNIGRLVPVKNHKMFLESVKNIKESKPTMDIRFVIAGDGELKHELNDYIINHDLEDCVIFAGWQKELSVLYASLDLVALTSMNEGTPVSLIEAMAAGKAVVSTRVGGVIDLMGKKRFIKDHNLDIFDNGILVKSGDAAAFAKALILLIEDKSLRDKMGAQGREYVKERFNIDRLVRDIERLYESL